MEGNFYPELSEKGGQEAQRLIDKFKKNLKKAADDVLRDMCCDIAPFIESDSWSNFRNRIMDGLKNYPEAKERYDYDFKRIREQLFKEYREEIVKDISSDILKENEALKKQIRDLQKAFRS